MALAFMRMFLSTAGMNFADMDSNPDFNPAQGVCNSMR
jgi:hypothetical protein